MGFCFLANAPSFIFVLVVFSFVRTPARAVPTTKVRFIAETVAGAKRAWQVKGCRNPILGVGAIAIVASPFIALVPAMAIIALHAGKVGTTWLVTAQGVGAVVAALTLPAVAKRTSRLSVLRGSMMTLAGALVIYAISPTLVVSALAMVVLGGAYMGALVRGSNTSVQVHAPLAERSRILALYTLSLSVFYPLGALRPSFSISRERWVCEPSPSSGHSCSPSRCASPCSRDRSSGARWEARLKPHICWQTSPMSFVAINPATEESHRPGVPRAERRRGG